MASDSDNKQRQGSPAPVSQQGSSATIGGGHPSASMVLPGNIAGNRPVSTTASVSGQLPVVNR